METIKVDLGELKELLFAGICSTEPNERTLLKRAQDKVIKKATEGEIFHPAAYKKLWQNVSIITEGMKCHSQFKDDYDNFNPLAENDYEFLAESNGEFAVLFEKN